MSADVARPDFTTRTSWYDAPVQLRRQTAAALGAAEIGFVDVHGGMSPGPAALLTMSDGRRVFVKAVSSVVSAGSHPAYVREAATLAALPSAVPVPTLLATVESGDWIALVTSYAPGFAAGPPWTNDSIRLVLAACEAIACRRAPDAVPPILDLLTDLDGWARLAGGNAGSLDAWEAERAGGFASLVGDWPAWTAGPWLVHQDVRADNAIVDLDSEIGTLVDWSFACAGAAWLDRARLAADIMCTGHADGPDAALMAANAILDAIDERGIRFVTALAGMWRFRSTLPPIPSLPNYRQWQLSRSVAVRPLLDHRS